MYFYCSCAYDGDARFSSFFTLLCFFFVSSHRFWNPLVTSLSHLVRSTLSLVTAYLPAGQVLAGSTLLPRSSSSSPLPSFHLHGLAAIGGSEGLGLALDSGLLRCREVGVRPHVAAKDEPDVLKLNFSGPPRQLCPQHRVAFKHKISPTRAPPTPRPGESALWWEVAAGISPATLDDRGHWTLEISLSALDSRQPVVYSASLPWAILLRCGRASALQLLT
jgi:hypothetical protein